LRDMPKEIRNGKKSWLSGLPNPTGEVGALTNVASMFAARRRTGQKPDGKKETRGGSVNDAVDKFLSKR
ncbi:MAG: hypothetical protein PHW24_05165, partial [Candidatus Moranbacteria bacterium]|nr:hypothetical protein [Candidatus Moranbacteria bacterium]